MAESMKGMKRTCRCAEVTEDRIGSEVTLMGWVQKSRNKGGIIFVDLRDRSGVMQLIFDSSIIDRECAEKAASLRSEYVIAVRGTVQKRAGAVNEKLSTGTMEVQADYLRILAESETPPFPVEENSRTRDEVRLKYRYLDLRRPDMQRNLMLRSKIAYLTREFFHKEGFLEIETPMLGKSTPEGARDYLVPSRVHPGSFYALPQSPQLFKQLLMCSGYDRYIQLARCFRDEDLRADRQPEFTQIDMELSFVDVDDVIDVNERYLQYLFREALGVDVKLPIQRMTWQEAMDRFGSDKPDLRFGMELHDVSDLVRDSEFAVFRSALEKRDGSVRGINAKGQGGLSRKKIDKLTEFAKGCGAGGLMYIALHEDGTMKSSFGKFMTDAEMEALVKALDGEPGDLLLFAADRNKIVWNVLGALRLQFAEQMGLLDPKEFRFVWITEFPLLEWSDEENRFMAMHHPFTMPMEEDWDKIDSDPGSVRAKAYDIVLNGNEIGGGSVRIHQNDIQEKMFEVLGFTKEQAWEQFSFLLTAFKYGVPPHAGLAYGLDRLVMLMAGADTIRDVIAFPKVKDASCLMTEAPSPVAQKQLDELGIEVSKRAERTQNQDES
ncbi:MAG: aspartate--tRNA ligase [Lachnospiraceae bacterium]|jgi:aspartyl-tRNA synthetase|nr:aspartate--tRNA ligase [Lachnospiraceae bacterium]MCI1327907.1 aspartate--tRNA ligase [Lachnospiraceae bacterium]